VAQVRLHVLDGRELRHVRRAGAAKHLMVDTLDSSLLARFLENAEQKIVRVDGLARLDGKMNASALASLAVVRQNSSSVSMERGSHTAASLPSVLVSTSMPSTNHPDRIPLDADHDCPRG
jgi:hypothetical protein